MSGALREIRTSGRDPVEVGQSRPGPGRGRTVRGGAGRGRAVRGLFMRFLPWGGAALVLFTGYLLMSRSRPVHADGSSNALQAWEMLHGNLLLRGWTLSDVSFYTTELPQYMLIELVYGYHADVVHVGGAMTYTLLVLLAAALARGRATGWAAAVRMGIAVAIMLVPAPGIGYSVVLLEPNHTGTAVPLLVTWLVLDRAGGFGRDGTDGRARRWLPYAVAVLLAWAQIGDPLALFIGAVPVVLVSAWRLYRDGQLYRDGRLRRPRGLDARLLVAGLASVLLTQAFLLVVWALGGFALHSPVAEVARPGALWRNTTVAAEALALNFGAYFPTLRGPLGVATGVLNLIGLLVALVAIGAAVASFVRRRRDAPGDRIADVLAVAVVINIVAFVVSTLPVHVLAARQIVAVLPFGAVLAGRVLAPRPVVRTRAVGVAAAVSAAVLCAAFVTQAVTARPVPPWAHDASRWLVAQGLSYGIGGYWAANTTTLHTSGRVTVAPVIGEGNRIYAYRWESRADWYDPARRDARFLVLDLQNPSYGSLEVALDQFGPPAQRRDFGRFTVLVYDRNLLVGLAAYCGPGVAAPSIERCPELVPRPPGTALLVG